MANKITNWVNYTRQYNSTKRELESLTNRELADIGISRWDIKNVAREQATKVIY